MVEARILGFCLLRKSIHEDWLDNKYVLKGKKWATLRLEIRQIVVSITTSLLPKGCTDVAERNRVSSLLVFLFASGLVAEDGNQSRFFHFIVILCTQAKQMRRMIIYCLFTISIFFLIRS